jgi:hypothetical protein
VDRQPTTAHPESVRENLRASQAAIAQAKLALLRLKPCLVSARARRIVDRLCACVDLAFEALERLSQ